MAGNRTLIRRSERLRNREREQVARGISFFFFLRAPDKRSFFSFWFLFSSRYAHCDPIGSTNWRFQFSAINTVRTRVRFHVRIMRVRKYREGDIVPFFFSTRERVISCLRTTFRVALKRSVHQSVPFQPPSRASVWFYATKLLSDREEYGCSLRRTF